MVVKITNRRLYNRMVQLCHWNNTVLFHLLSILTEGVGKEEESFWFEDYSFEFCSI